jgi:hypothetical protein
MTKEPALEVPRKGGVWEAPTNLRGDDGQAPSVPPDRRLMIVRVGIRKTALSDAGKFTLSQWRLICAPRGLANPLAAKGQAVYPIGFVQGNKTLVHKPLDETFILAPKDVPGNAKTYDLAFAVPSEMVPALIEFKQNNVEQLPAAVAADEAPPAEAASGEGPSAAPAQPAPQGEPNAQTPPTARRPRQGRRGDQGNRGSGLSGVGQNLTGGALEDINPQ